MGIRFPFVWLIGAWSVGGTLVADPGKEHWAFRPVREPAVPQVAGVSHPIDALLASAARRTGVVPNPEADARVLIRRLHLDLWGLPPSAEEVDAFVRAYAAQGEQAYGRLVDRLLESPRYAERWARHWLDVARWAESEGYESNHLRPAAWRYRDWVVQAFREDLPFDRFVAAQVAGDELVPYADDHLVATGFLAAARLSSNEEDKWRQRNDILVDVVNATGSAFLGLTLQCAQCHNHRIDPISQRDYYRFQGFFVKGQPGNLVLQSPDLWKDYLARKPADYDALTAERDRLFAAAKQRKIDEVRGEIPPAALEALDKPMEKRSMAEEKLARQTDLRFAFGTGQIERSLTPVERKGYDELKKRIAALEKGMPEKPHTFGFHSPATSPHAVQVLPMRGFYPLPYEPKQLVRARAYLLGGGDVHLPREALEPGWPELFGPTPAAQVAERPRTALARWLTREDNPLVHRVWVNRIWHWHFGRGIVGTPSDFGLAGAKPSHPELLDWLVGQFRKFGGRTKPLHRLIVTSAAYRRSAAPNEANRQKDPDNRTWWRWQPRRLEAEAVRDSWLQVAGELDPAMGGPGVAANDSLRRSLYLLFMGGGPSQVDTFDPKPLLQRLHGRDVPDSIGRQVPRIARAPLTNLFASPYRFHRRGRSGLPVSELFPHVGNCMDDLCVLRSCRHDTPIHAPAEYLATTGTQVGDRPSLGAWVTYGLGSVNRDLPAFLVLKMGETGRTPAWSNGFLPSRYQGTVVETTGIPDLRMPRDIGERQRRAQLGLLAGLNRRHQERLEPNSELEARIRSYEMAFRMQTAAPELFDLRRETRETKDLYGVGTEDTETFGTMCLLARRMVERGVRFVQLRSGGWDAHGNLAANHGPQARKTDRPIAGLLTDLKRRGLLDSTLVIWGGEFGRTPTAENPGPTPGRNHSPSGYTMWLAGGGTKGGQAIGATDEVGYAAIERPIHPNDLHATVLHALGVDQYDLLYRHHNREEMLTVNGGEVIEEAFRG